MRFFPIHQLSNSKWYCWVIVFAGMLGLLASLGLGRFSLGIMLPAMGEALELSYSQMGLISTVNFCGYLAAVLMCGNLSQLFGPRLLIFSALVLVGGSMILIGFSSNLAVIILLYCGTGIGSALSNIPIMALISAWFAPRMRGRAAGLCIMGNGLGILLSGQLVPWLGAAGQEWRMSWQVLGGLVLAIAFLCVLLIRNEPAHLGNRPKTAAPGSRRKLLSFAGPDNKSAIVKCSAIYFLFGFTYVIYITFMVTSLVEERGMSEYAAGELWSLVGLISLGSGPIFGYLSDRIGRKTGLTVVFSIQTVAYFLVAMNMPMLSVHFSIVLFALVAFSVPTIIAALVADYVGAQKSAAAFGFVTFIFGIGQIAGPAIAGILAESFGTFSVSFFMAGTLTLAALILSTRLPSPK